MIVPGSRVLIHYTLKVDGIVVDTTLGGDPLAYVQGDGTLVPGVEKGLAGAETGEKRRLIVEPAEGYGDPLPELLTKAPLDSFSHLHDFHVGAVITGRTPDGPFRGVVREIGETEVILDLNHPLAGKTLEFDVEVISIGIAASKDFRPGA